MARILIVDDDEQVRNVFHRLFENESFEVHEAADGNEALESIRRFPADIVITDIVMPEKEGFQTIRELRREFPALKIIAVSGGGLLDPGLYLECAKQIGASYAFSKPVDRNVLLDAVRKLLET